MSPYSEIANNTNNEPCQTQLTNLKNFTTYNLAVSAITKSRQIPGKLYESQFSSYHQIFVSPGCEIRTELVSVFARSVSPSMEKYKGENKVNQLTLM